MCADAPSIKITQMKRVSNRRYKNVQNVVFSVPRYRFTYR